MAISALYDTLDPFPWFPGLSGGLPLCHRAQAEMDRHFANRPLSHTRDEAAGCTTTRGWGGWRVDNCTGHENWSGIVEVKNIYDEESMSIYYYAYGGST